jgi:hypothetical protein
MRRDDRDALDGRLKTPRRGTTMRFIARTDPGRGRL